MERVEIRQVEGRSRFCPQLFPLHPFLTFLGVASVQQQISATVYV